MRLKTLTLAALLAGLSAVPALAGGAPGGSAGPGAPMTQVTAAELSAIIVESGASVIDVVAGEEGYLVKYQLAGGLHGYIEGYDCTGGPGPDAVCADLEMGGVFTADDADHALRLERELSFVWISDYADVENSEYLVWRRDCLHGGVTRTQLVYTFSTLNEQLQAVADAVWPDTGLARPADPVET